MAFFNGKKTYFISALMVVYALSGYLLGKLDFDQALQLFLTGSGFATLRHGVK